MATVIEAREGPLAIFGDGDEGRVYVLVGENTAQAAGYAALASATVASIPGIMQPYVDATAAVANRVGMVGFTFGEGNVFVDPQGYGGIKPSALPVKFLTGFTFGAAHVVSDTDGYGAPIAAGAQVQIVAAFTFGDDRVTVDMDGYGSPAATADSSTTQVRMRRLFPNMGMEGLFIPTVEADPGFTMFDNTTPSTFFRMLETAQHFDAVRLVFCNSSDVPLTIGKCSVSSRDNRTPTDNNVSAAQVPVTFNGSASVMLPAKLGVFRPSYVVSDWISLSSLARADGGAGGILCALAYMSTSYASVTIPILRDYNGWATRTDGKAAMSRANAGDCVTTPANFTSTANIALSPIAGVQYAARGMVLNFGASGDSITAALKGTPLRNDGFLLPIAASFNDASKIAVETVGLGWSGSPTTSFRQRYEDFVNAGLRTDLMLWCGGSGNDTGAGTVTLTQAHINTFRANRYLAGRLMRSQGTLPLFWTWGPYGSGSYDYNASDALRVADNAEIMALANKGVLVSDFAAALYGSTDADGQQQPNFTLLADQVHPNGSGYAAMSTPGIATLNAALLAA